VEKLNIMTKKIFCKGCPKYLGEIRDATLHRKIVFLCENCETKRLASDLAGKTEPNPLRDLFGKGGIGGMFG